MNVRPGSRLVLWLVGLCAWSVLGLVWPLLFWLLPVFFVAIVVAGVMEYRALRQGLAGLTLRRQHPSPVARDREFVATIEIFNSTPRSWIAEVRDEVPSTSLPGSWVTTVTLPASSATSLVQSFRIPIRGRFHFGPTWIRLLGPWGLLEGHSSFGSAESVQVYPESLLSKEELAKDAADEMQLLDKLRHSAYRGAGTEFESLEEFRLGDDPRRIDWRTSARHRRLIVRRFQIERHRDLMILVDCGRLMGADAGQGTKLDCAVDSALRLLRVALRGGDRCGIGIFDDQVQGYLRPIGGRQAMQTFLSSLYDLQPKWRESDFSTMFATLQSRQQKRALVVVISDVVDAQTSSRYRASLLALAERHVVLFAALRTPLLGKTIDEPLTSVADGFKKAATFRVLRERELAIHELRRGGVHVIDVEPSHLTVPLINQFVELRQSNLL